MRTEREKMLAGELYDPLDAELVQALAILEQLEIRHFRGRTDTILVGGGNDQSHVVQQFHRHRNAIESQTRTHQYGGHSLRQK